MTLAARTNFVVVLARAGRIAPTNEVMETLLPQLLSFPPHPQELSDHEYDRLIKALAQLLQETSASKLAKGVVGGGDLLDILDPAINTLPYLFTLLAHLGGTHDEKQSGNGLLKVFHPGGQLWEKMLEFVERFDPVQIRYAGHEWRRLLEKIARVGDLSNKPLMAIPPIRTAILRLDPSAACFTSNHLLLAKLCLQAKAFQAALPLLDHDVFHMPSNPDKMSYFPLPCGDHETSSTFITTSSGLSDKLAYRDYLMYFLYGGMIYLGLKDWTRALLFLEVVIMAPTGNVASMIQVEAYKKWVLVGLLLKGMPMAMPKTTNSYAARTFRAIAKPYDTLADAFKEGNGEKLYAEVQAGQQTWHKDCNMGLVLQVLNAFRRFLILKLEKTYAALPISLIAQQTSPQPNNIAETESYLTSLIASGQLNATLVPSTNIAETAILRFAATSHDGPLARSEMQNFKDLHKQTVKFTYLTRHIKDTERRLELSKDYLEWARKNQKPKDTGPETANQGTMGNNGYGVDEDMLADM
ncbi:hypothetical protein MMC15_006569 [Xylographa vitiligo]|nr:hypothetical protein [Xylographa vitiligo]